jgi:hypothetical protein
MHFADFSCNRRTTWEIMRLKIKIRDGAKKRGPILRKLILQLQRQDCSRLERFYIGKNPFYSKARSY